MNRSDRNAKLNSVMEGVLGDAAKYWGNKAKSAVKKNYKAAGYAAYKTAGTVTKPLRKAAGWSGKKLYSGAKKGVTGAAKALGNTAKGVWKDVMKKRAAQKRFKANQKAYAAKRLQLQRAKAKAMKG